MATFVVRPTFLASSAASRITGGAQFFFCARFVSGLYTAGADFTNSSSDRGTKKVLRPTDDIPLCDPKTGRVTEAWSRWFRFVDIQKLGGVLGPSLPDVVANVTTIQDVATTSIAQIANITQVVEANAASQAASVEVAQSSGDPGADQIPPPILTVPVAPVPRPRTNESDF